MAAVPGSNVSLMRVGIRGHCIAAVLLLAAVTSSVRIGKHSLTQIAPVSLRTRLGGDGS